MPRIRSKQILGENPVNPTDLTTKQYVDNLLSGYTGSGSITILDENTTVLTGVTTINFLGVDVSARAAGSNQVNVYIPSPDYAPYFNTGTSTVNNISTTNRNISAPTSEGNPYKIGNWIAGTSHPSIRNNVTNLVYSTSSEFNINDLTTTFTASVLDADNISILANNTITLDSNKSNSLNGITINVANFTSDFDKYKANISVNIQISSILPQGGRFSISLVHNNSGTPYTFTQNDIFRDNENLTSSIDGTLTVITGNTIQTKQISGVHFYTTNTQWHVHLDQINNLNSISYPTSEQLRIVDNNLFISETIQVNGNDNEFVNGTWSNLYNTTNTSYDKVNWVTDQLNNTNWIDGSLLSTSATATIYDWSLTDTLNSVNYNYLIDTFEDLSDRNSEMFRSEDNSMYPRLESDLSTPWDNTSTLTDGLQIIGDRLVYPQYDFTSFEPQVLNQPDYTTISGDKTYYRKFDTNGSNVSNGIILFSDHNITESDLSNNNVIFEISINGTDWYSLNSEYIGGTLSNGSGCRVDIIEYGLGSGTISSTSLRYTLGTGGTTTSLYLKITYSDTDKTKYIGGLDFIDGNWI